LFEQRVLQAYREQVAQQKQLQFLRELEEEENAAEAREARKAKDAQKKKDKRRYVAQTSGRFQSWISQLVLYTGSRSKRKRMNV